MNTPLRTTQFSVPGERQESNITNQSNQVRKRLSNVIGVLSQEIPQIGQFIELRGEYLENNSPLKLKTHFQELPHLKHLALKYTAHEAIEKHIEVFSEFGQHIEHLELCVTFLGHSTPQSINTLFSSFPNLKTLILDRSGLEMLEADHLVSLFSLLPPLHSLTFKSFKFAALSPKQLEILSSLLQSCQHIGLENESLALLSPEQRQVFFKNLPNITSLGMKGNDDFIKMNFLPKLLSNLPELQHLDLGWCDLAHLSQENFEEVCQSISKIPSLNLSHNHLSALPKESFSLLSESLKMVKTLDISHNALGDESAKLLCLTKNLHQCQSLGLSCNHLHLLSKNDLTELANTLSSIHELHLDTNGWTVMNPEKLQDFFSTLGHEPKISVTIKEKKYIIDQGHSTNLFSIKEIFG